VNYFHILLILSAITTSCTLSSTSKSSNYKEDLSAYRLDYDDLEAKDSMVIIENETGKDSLQYTFMAEDEITEELNTFLDSISSLRKQGGYVTGYSIQVFTGRDREEATSMKNRVYRVLPDSRPKLIFDSPNFEVKVGQYYTKMEAHKDFVALKSSFPTTIIIPERIKIQHESD